MNGQPRVQRHETAGVSAGHLDQPGVIDLLMTKRAGVDRGIIRGGRSPEPVRFEPGPLFQQRRRIRALFLNGPIKRAPFAFKAEGNRIYAWVEPTDPKNPADQAVAAGLGRILKESSEAPPLH